MNSSTHVVFLTQSDDTLVNLARDLSRLGFAIHMHREPGTFHSAFVLDTCPLIFVGFTGAVIQDVVTRVRSEYPTAGVIAYAAFADGEHRVRTLLSGADHCIEPGTSTVEIAAVLRTLARRGADILAAALVQAARPGAVPRAPDRRGPAGAASLWRVANKGWTLVAPSGRALALTAGERELLQRFFESPDRKIRREMDPVFDNASMQTGVSPRVVDVMISRLRRKASLKQIGLPIRAVPGWGYVFAGEIERLDESDVSNSSEPMQASDADRSVLQSTLASDTTAWRSVDTCDCDSGNDCGNDCECAAGA